ncbi:MAG: hypothetical protein HC927_04235 [Deltaproteobacteria bacterium]|nr:hypothetical protein [Deltaproteobacteria bacterium]
MNSSTSPGGRCSSRAPDGRRHGRGLDMIRFDYDLDEVIVLTNDGTGSFTASEP